MDTETRIQILVFATYNSHCTNTFFTYVYKYCISNIYIYIYKFGDCSRG